MLFTPVLSFVSLFAFNANDEIDSAGQNPWSQHLPCSRMPAALPTPTALGRRIRAARLAREWTQAQLGERLFGHEEANTTAPRISRWERGMHKPDLDAIERLAEVLNLPAAYFMATSDIVAEAILVISQLSPAKQRKALKLLRELAEQSGASPPRKGA